MNKIKNLVALLTMLTTGGVTGQAWGMEDGDNKDIFFDSDLDTDPVVVILQRYEGNTVYVQALITKKKGAADIDCLRIVDLKKLVNHDHTKITIAGNEYPIEKREVLCKKEKKNIYLVTCTIKAKQTDCVEYSKFEKNAWGDTQKRLGAAYIGTIKISKNSGSLVFEPMDSETKISYSIIQGYASKKFMTDFTDIIGKISGDQYIQMFHPEYTIPIKVKKNKYSMNWVLPAFFSAILGGLQEYLDAKKYGTKLSYGTTIVPVALLSMHRMAKSKQTGWKKWMPVLTSAAGYGLGKLATHILYSSAQSKKQLNF